MTALDATLNGKTYRKGCSDVPFRLSLHISSYPTDRTICTSSPQTCFASCLVHRPNMRISARLTKPSGAVGPVSKPSCRTTSAHDGKPR
jgi:hypothetical protein